MQGLPAVDVATNSRELLPHVFSLTCRISRGAAENTTSAMGVFFLRRREKFGVGGYFLWHFLLYQHALWRWPLA
jgi:hypothetical protein